MHTDDPPSPDLPLVDPALFDRPSGPRFAGVGSSIHPPRFLLLYGSLRERSYSKLLTLEAARLLRALGGEVRIVDPTGLRAAGQALAAALALMPAALVLAVPSGSVRMFLSAAVAAGVYLLATVNFAVRRDDASARVLLLSSLGALLGLLSAAVVFGGPASLTALAP
jgi:hypothetical protein